MRTGDGDVLREWSMIWLFDCDGVLWRGDNLLPTACEALTVARGAGVRCVFVSNFSHPTVAEYQAKLARLGATVEAGDIITSSHAAARLAGRNAKAFVCGGPGLSEALQLAGTAVVRAEDADTVLAGRLPGSWDLANEAVDVLLRGARFIATNDDPLYPTASGHVLGTGALVAALEVAGGQKAEIAGKPHEPMVRLIKERFGTIDAVIGDREATDGALARRLGARFAHIRSGFTKPDAEFMDATEVRATDVSAADVLTAVAELLS